jgi:hypothetical protein
MTAGNPEVMQAASNLHDQVRNAFLGEAQSVLPVGVLDTLKIVVEPITAN